MTRASSPRTAVDFVALVASVALGVVLPAAPFFFGGGMFCRKISKPM